jgi:hypothetical protein
VPFVGAVVRKVEVLRAGRGSLEVRWQLDQPTEVDVSVGTTPVPLEHSKVVRVVEGTDRKPAPGAYLREAISRKRACKPALSTSTRGTPAAW